MFRTEINIEPSEFKISYKSRILSLGSCFADEIGQLLEYNKFSVLVNPLGIIFNPVSISKTISYCLKNEMPSDDSYLENQGLFSNYNMHSHVSGTDMELFKLKVKKILSETADFLFQADWLFLSFGTSIVYRRKDNGEIVANCHKIPSKNFVREFLEIDQVVQSIKSLIQNTTERNPNLKVILTVSPIRHLKESLEDNSISKSILRIACNKLCDMKNVEYFPAYEIVLDDLRDYRFFKQDLLHPNQTAIDYVWDKFMGRYFDDETIKIIKKWNKIAKSLNHKPFNPGSQAHLNFIKKTINEMEKFSFPFDISKEIEGLKSVVNEKTKSTSS